MRRRDLLGAALAAAGGATARAQALIDTLRVSWSDTLDTLDPYATPLRTGLVIGNEVFDCLVDRDPETLEFSPLLAVRWTQTDDVTFDFALRTGVWFHDGSPFGPDDVVATVARVRRGDRIAVPANYTWLAGAERTGEYGVRLHLAHPFPAALFYIGRVLPILPRGAVPPPDSAIGTGPWQVESLDRWARRIELRRFEAHAAGESKPTPSISRLSITQTDDNTASYSDLVAGLADWTWQLTPHQFSAVTLAPELQALRGDSMRVVYLSMDAAGRTDPAGPLTRLKVRQAICHALNRESLGALIVPDGARIVDAPCYPTQFGCDVSAAVKYDYSPDRARALLVEAGFSGGFATRLVTYARRDLVEAVVAQLASVGIRADAVIAPTEAAMRLSANGEAPLFLGSWGSSSINDLSAILPEFFGAGPQDYARLPGLADLLMRAGFATRADARRALYDQAIALITSQAAWLPLFLDTATYAFSRQLQFRPSADELPRFYRASWRRSSG